ncbi:hypothetical protein HNP48_002708 [Acidovorax soli]|uniref:Uncharacterized protein n=1 Tax=Acidovorax soli TaxID=592050 RepID=A0A7X0PDY0_9BURK|nr:hypothetical protein [Acidovorax soli]MBB6560036.1 hypothetical protein [Acidovorax soli]
MREARWLAWFFAVVGGGVFVFSAWGALTLAAPPPTPSLLRGAMAQALQAALGTPAGWVVYHLLWATLGAGVAWVGVRVLRQEQQQRRRGR